MVCTITETDYNQQLYRFRYVCALSTWKMYNALLRLGKCVFPANRLVCVCVCFFLFSSNVSPALIESQKHCKFSILRLSFIFSYLPMELSLGIVITAANFRWEIEEKKPTHTHTHISNANERPNETGIRACHFRK